MPDFVFAPVYSVLLLVDKLTGHLGHISSHYPFGLDNPVQSLGTMIFAARLTTLFLALASIYYLTRTLQKMLAAGIGPVLAVLLSLSTSVFLLESFSDSKPDGMMIAFILFALANYAAIVLDGFTLTRAIGLAFFYVASFSCKELTVVTMFLPYLGLLLVGLFALRQNKEEGKRSLKMLGFSCLSAVLFYLLINVVYAPHTWIERLTIVFGPLKDPSIWASAHQTTGAYLLASVMAVAGSLGWFGILLFVATVAGSIAYYDRRLLLLWLPFVSHLVLTIVLAGYMPPYFMLPLGPALCLPSSFVLCRFIREAELSHVRLRIATILVAVGCTWMAFTATALFRYSHLRVLYREAMEEVIPSGAVVSPVELFDQKEELHVVGRKIIVEEVPLAKIMVDPPRDRPQYLIVDHDQRLWIEEIKSRPARAEMVKQQLGFDYSVFNNFESLGYVPQGISTQRLPRWVLPALVAGSKSLMENHLEIYRELAK
jgi:hypothetical protein